MTPNEAYEKMLEYLDSGIGVLTASEIHPDIPLIHDVGHRHHRLRTKTEVQHARFGRFIANTASGCVYFHAGGAMHNAKHEDGSRTFSWTQLVGFPSSQTIYLDDDYNEEIGGIIMREIGYDFDAAKAAVRELSENNHTE